MPKINYINCEIELEGGEIFKITMSRTEFRNLKILVNKYSLGIKNIQILSANLRGY